MTASKSKKRGFFANVMIVSGGTVVAQVISLLTSPILARLFGPEAFGVATIFATICAIAGVVGCLRYDGAILLPKENADGSALLSLSIVAAAGLGALSALVLATMGETVLGAIGAEALWSFAWILPVGIFLQSVASPLMLFAQRTERFDLVTAVRVIAMLSTIVVSIGVGWVGFRSGEDLVYARSATMMLLVPLPLAIWIALRAQAAGWSWPSFAQLRKNASRFREFPLVNTWAALLDMLSLQATPLVLAALFSTTVVGLYAMAIRLVSLPCQFVSTAVGQVFFQHAAAAHARGDKEAFARSVQSVAHRLVTLGVLPVLLVALLGPPAVGIVFGERWLKAGYYVSLLAPETLAMFITSPIVPLLYVLEMHRFNVAINAFLLVLRVGSLWLGAKLTGTPEGALIANALAMPAGLAVLNIVLLRSTGVPVRDYLQHLTSHLAAALPCLLVWWLFDNVWQAPWLLTSAVTIAAGVPYTWLAMRTDPEAVEMVMSFGRKIRNRISIPR